VVRAVSIPTTERAALIAMRCRTGRLPAAAARGVELLAAVLGRRLGLVPRLIGSPQPALVKDYGSDLAAAHGCLLEAGGQVDDAVTAGVLPVMVAGDAAVALTTLPTVGRLRPEARVLWLDAHGAFNTPQTTPSGYLAGMALSGACGRWGTGLEGQLPVARVVLCGVRELDDGERRLLEQSRVPVIGTTLETLVFLQNALDGAPTYVHLDVDVLDATVMPVSHAIGGGLEADKLLDLLDAVADSCEIVGVEVTGFEALEDAARSRSLAETVAGALDPLLSGVRRDANDER
jgi:arginase